MLKSCTEFKGKNKIHYRDISGHNLDSEEGNLCKLLKL